MKLLQRGLLLGSTLAVLGIPLVSALQGGALAEPGRDQFPSSPSTTFPAPPYPGQSAVFPEVKQPIDSKHRLGLVDTGGTYIADPKPITVTPGGNPRPWRGLDGRFTSNPFGNAPSNLYE